MQLKGLKINFLGDSITEGHGTSAPDRRFSELISARFGAQCRNYGISGTRIARQVKPSDNPRWDLCFCDRVKEMAEDADVVAVFGGTNDYGHGDAPIGTMQDRTPATFYGALHTLYRSMIDKFPAAAILVITPLHRISEEVSFGDPVVGNCAPLKNYVEIIREVAEYYSLPVLDLYRSGAIQPAVDSVRQRLVPDGLHPNDAGHVLLAEKIAGFIASL